MSVREEVEVGLWQEVGDKREERSSALAPGCHTRDRPERRELGCSCFRVWEPWAAAGIPLSCLSRELEDSSSLKASNEGTKLQIFVNIRL